MKTPMLGRSGGGLRLRLESLESSRRAALPWWSDRRAENGATPGPSGRGRYPPRIVSNWRASAAGANASVPSLAVVLCTCEGARWLPTFLDSLAAQELPPDVVYIRDDASTDKSPACIERFAAAAPFRVVVAHNAERVGSTANFELALADCDARIVALADQDDVWYPSKLSVIMQEFASDPTVSMVFSDADLIGEDERPLGSRLWDTRLVGRTLRHYPVVPERLFARRGLATGSTMAVRRRVVDAALPFPDELEDDAAPMRHDRWLSLVAASVGTVRALDESLIGFRVHPAQQTGVLVGAQLRSAVSRAVTGVVSGPGSGAGLEARGRQLAAAAERAEYFGDFEDAATLRRIAEHNRQRSRVGMPGYRAGEVVRAAKARSYQGDPLWGAAIAADLVRSIVRRRAVQVPEADEGGTQGCRCAD